MFANKPTVILCARDAEPGMIAELCAGMEEEGILWTLTEAWDGDARMLADRAAELSTLGCGIGVFRREAALQMRGMPAGEPVFLFQNPDPQTCRKLGANAARAIQKKPFLE